VWREETQEVEVSKRKREEERRGSTSVRSIGENKTVLQGEGAVSKQE